MSEMEQDLAGVLFTEEEIAEHVRKLGEAITYDYAGHDVVVVGVLRGAAIFMSDLVRQIDIPVEMDFMVVSSYGNSTKSSGTLNIKKDLSSPIEGRDVIIAEDILDSGITLSRLKAMLEERGAKSVEIACCFIKDGVQQVPVDVKYQALHVPNEFVVGYGLDYAEKYRNLRYLAILDPKVYS